MGKNKYPDVTNISCLHEQGMTNREIAAVIAVSPSVVSYYTKKLGLVANGTKQRITVQQEQLILKLNMEGKGNRQIAKQVNCSHFSVHLILKKNGLKSSRPGKRKLNIIDSKHARCSECGGVFPIGHFQLHERKQSNYRESYCKKCRRQKTVVRNNGNVERHLRSFWYELQRRSKNRNINFRITESDLISMWKAQEGKCFYTDVPMTWGRGNGNQRNGVSVDKIRPTLGYVVGNVVLCTRRANSIKSDLSVEELRCWVPSFYERISKMCRPKATDTFKVDIDL